MGGGSILDLGVYALHFVDSILGPGKPESIVSTGVLNNNGTDENVSAILKYFDGKMAVISTHTKTKMDCSAYIYGTNGAIKVISRLKQLFMVINVLNYKLIINLR